MKRMKMRTMRRLLVKSMEVCDGMARIIFALSMALGLKKLRGSSSF